MVILSSVTIYHGISLNMKVQEASRVPTRGNDTDRCLKVKKVTVLQIGVKSTLHEVVLGVTTGKGGVPHNG